VGGNLVNMDSSAAIEGVMAPAPAPPVADAEDNVGPTRSWCADSERWETEIASVGKSAWFDCKCQSWPDPALIPNGTGPCPGLNVPPPTLDPPSELGDPASGMACMRE